MTDIDAELMHREAIFFKLLPKEGRGFAIFLGHRRQVEHHKEPHNMISV